ncbi:DUF6783 domain-containing protein [Blautia sp. MSJ-9]
MRAKYTANWGVQIAGMIFQTRSRINPHLHGKFQYSFHNKDCRTCE